MAASFWNDPQWDCLPRFARVCLRTTGAARNYFRENVNFAKPRVSSVEGAIGPASAGDRTPSAWELFEGLAP